MPSKAPDLKQQTEDSLELATVLRFFAVKAQTREGKARVLALDLLPPERQVRHFAELAEWRRWLKNQRALRFPEIPAPNTFQRDAPLDPFDAETLRGIRDVLGFWRNLTRDKSLLFAHRIEVVDPGLAALTVRLQSLFEPNGDWRADVSPRHESLVKRWMQTDRQLDQTLSGLVRKYSAYLNETIVFERNQRKVLAVKLQFKGRVRGILQDYSASGNTVYIEPEASVDPQNRLTRILAEVEEELWRIRGELTQEILSRPGIAGEICPRLARMDMMQALALTAKETDSRDICPNREWKLELCQVRHPFLDESFAALRQEVFRAEERDDNHMVPFNLCLDETLRGLIISGANTGGKTVTLKTMGLIALMANRGLPVPVDEGSRVPYYRHIFGDIGDHQSLSHNLSTFASHLANMKHILRQRDAETLVLLDELGSGTDPREGTALSQAMIETLVARRLHLCVTTHQRVLCTLALNHPHLENGSMIFDNQRLKPTFQFQQGVPGRSHALEIAASTGLPSHMLARAGALLDDHQVDIQAAIVKLQEQHKALQKQKHKHRRNELRLHHRIQEVKQETASLKRLREEIREKARARVEKEVTRAERELRTVLKEIREKQRIRGGVGRFSTVRRELLEPLDHPRKLPPIDIEISKMAPEDWRPGDKVYLKTWKTEGRLVSIDRERARVDCNGKKMAVPLDDVWHLKQNAVEDVEPRVTEFVDSSEGEAPFELRLLGYRVEEALMELERAVDRALRKGAPLMRVIHGHGSGALKKAVRDFLRKHPAANCFSVVADERNDGVTELKFED